MQLSRLWCHEAWNLGVVEQSAADIVRRGIVMPVRWLPAPPAWTMLADPAVRHGADGGLEILAEWLDYRTGLGEIHAARVAPGADPAAARFAPALRDGAHLSYPFPLGGGLMAAESWEAGAARLWREEADGWREAGRLLPGPVVDPTLHFQDGRWWLFCTLRGDGPESRLHLFHAQRIEGPWTSHPCNPVKVDQGSARPAGPLFMADGVLVRPGQDCTGTYGRAVVLNAVTRLDAEGFAEEPIRRIEPDPAGPYPDGLHTICPAGQITLIDGKRWRFHPLEPLRKLWVGRRNRLRRERLAASQ